MRRMRSWAMVIAAMLACTQAANASSNIPQFVVVGAPLVPYVSAIAGDVGRVDSLLSPAQDVHEFALAPSQMKMLSTADALIVPDLTISPALAALTKKLPKLNVIELTKLEGAEPLAYTTQNPWLNAVKAKAEKDAPKKETAKPDPFDYRHHEDAHHHDHDATALDPHLWLDPERMAAIAEPLARTLALATPDHQPTFLLNAKALAQHLRQDVTPALSAMLKAPPAMATNEKTELPYILGHSAYQYFLARFGLGYYGQLSTGGEEFIGAKSMDILLQAASTQRIRCLIAESNTTLIARLAKASGARVLLLQPEQLPTGKSLPPTAWIENDYDRFLYTIADGFRGCLQ